MSASPSERARIKREAFRRSGMHEFVIDPSDDVSCLRCRLPRRNWRHGDKQVRLVVEKYGGPDGSTVCRYMDEPLLAEPPL